MEFIKLTKGTDAITIFNNLGFFKLSKDSGGEDLPATTSLVYTLSSDGTYYIVGTGFTSIEAIDADTSGGTAGSGLDNTWSGGQLVIPAKHNDLPVKAIAPRAFSGVLNITEAYISNGITTIGHRAFQCPSPNFDTTMTFIKFPKTLLSIGGFYPNGAGRILWGRQGLENVVVNFGEITQPLQLNSSFAYAKANEITLNSLSEIPLNTKYHSMFQYSEIDKLTFGDNFKTFYDANDTSQKATMFYEAKINEIHFKNATSFGCSANAENVFHNSLIGAIYFHKDVYITYSGRIPFSGIHAGVKIFFETGGATLGISTAIPTNTVKLFFNKDFVDYYSTATNWTTHMPTSIGTYSSRTFVFGDYNQGDTLPKKIGTAGKAVVYAVQWYEDMNFTTLASDTAISTKRYYGKITKSNTQG